MRHICAWCGCETAPPDGNTDDDIISPGICKECKQSVLAETEEIQAREGLEYYGLKIKA